MNIYVISAIYFILGGVAVWAKIKSHNNKHPGYKFTAIVLSFIVIIIAIVDLIVSPMS